ncbi:hypothetical protein EDB89DRAFT_1941039 [Lactarius sanguifluus]|nr:hypothetical protein EDB89DRAFT_1941039 [Lactarius sanguifluus]
MSACRGKGRRMGCPKKQTLTPARLARVTTQQTQKHITSVECSRKKVRVEIIQLVHVAGIDCRPKQCEEENATRRKLIPPETLAKPTYSSQVYIGKPVRVWIVILGTTGLVVLHAKLRGDRVVTFCAEKNEYNSCDEATSSTSCLIQSILARFKLCFQLLVLRGKLTVGHLK